MPEPIITPLEPEDSSLRHPKVEPDLRPRAEISGNTKPNLVEYGSGDYWQMALAVLRDWVSGKVNGGGVPLETVLVILSGINVILLILHILGVI